MVLTEPNKIVLGKIIGPQGLKGWLKVYSYTRPPESIFDYASWQLEFGRGKTAKVENYTSTGKNLAVKLIGVDDRAAAESLKYCEIFVESGQLETLNDGEYFWHQLVGLSVINSDDKDIGVVKELIETGTNDVLVIQGDADLGLTALPWIPDVIIKTDLEAGEIHVDWQFDE